MYCHVCQADAKRVVAIYRELAGRPAAARVRMVGLGVGNTPMETHTFTSKFGLPFPTFPDRSNAIIRRFGRVHVPSLVILRRTGGTFQVVDRADSIPADPAAFVNRVLSHL
jgi:peroxiredoxin